jgi:two-component sensor histidine kinase
VFLHNTKAAGGGSLRKGDSVLMDSWPKEAIEQWKGLYDRVLEGEKIGMDIQRTRFTPEPRYMEYQFSPIYGEGGGIGGVSVHGRDITERKAAEMRIQGLLDEKEALVREINHRVKNTMSVIESLVSLHLQRLQDPAAVEALNDITGKIRSMRLLYEQLESTGNYQEAKLGSYLPGIVNEAVSVFPDSRKVKTEFQVEDFLLDVKTMSVVGIMASEIVTNAMKYAFQGREAGRIRVAASRSGKRVRISLSDDGIGIPEHAGFGSSKGLGMTLIKGFADQLGGSIRIERAQGSTFVLEFDTEKQKT